MISYGLESGNEAILEGINKKISLPASRKAVRMAHEMGIKVAGHFIFGFPGETRQTLEETLRFALELPLDIAQFYAAAPFPGTNLYDEALRQGWLSNRDSDLFPAAISQNDAALELPGLPAAEVDSFRRRAYRKFYGRPRILGGLLSMVEPGAAAQALTGMKRFLNWVR